MTFNIITLGCKVNQYESQVMTEVMLKDGFTHSPDKDHADIFIVNTCTVTSVSDSKNRKLIRRIRRNNENAIIVVTGCMSQAFPEDEVYEICDIVVGNTNRKIISKLIKDYVANSDHYVNVEEHTGGEIFEPIKITNFEERTRAQIKIEDGCNRFCAYCIIPYARGRIRSRKMDSIREEMVRLAEKGFKEIVLTGINLGCYSDGEKTLIDVIEMADEIEGIERVRLGSLDPEVITPDFVDRIGKCRKICPHFHLSLQSGCNNTLKAMNRHYTAEEYFEKCEMLRSVFENPAFTTDIIVGFPGESDEDFETSLEFAKKVEFSRIHVFKYSKRDGTVAAKMPNQVDERIKSKRSDILIAAGEELVKKYNENKLGTYDFVLWEERKQINGREYWVGHTPDYVEVALETDEELAGKIQKVALKDIINQEIILATQ